MTMLINICGIDHKIIECEDNFDTDMHLGQIDYSKAIIKINKDLPPQMKDEAICHEVMHGIFLHLGYQELADNEQLVQALATAVNQAFDIKRMDEPCLVKIEKGEW